MAQSQPLTNVDSPIGRMLCAKFSVMCPGERMQAGRQLWLDNKVTNQVVKTEHDSGIYLKAGVSSTNPKRCEVQVPHNTYTCSLVLAPFTEGEKVRALKSMKDSLTWGVMLS